MYRILGRAKPAEAAAPAAPPPDFGAHVSKLESRVPELDRKIGEINGQLQRLQAQLSRTAPGQQAGIKQQMLMLLKRRKLYEQQRGSVQQQAFNLDQGA